MRKPREFIQPRWGVCALRKRAEKLGTVKARDEREAIERALKEDRIADAVEVRISLRRKAWGQLPITSAPRETRRLLHFRQCERLVNAIRAHWVGAGARQVFGEP